MGEDRFMLHISIAPVDLRLIDYTLFAYKCKVCR